MNFELLSVPNSVQILVPEFLYAILGLVTQNVLHSLVPRPGIQFSSRGIELTQEVLVLVQHQPVQENGIFRNS